MVIISAVSSANKELFVKNGLFLHMGLLAFATLISVTRQVYKTLAVWSAQKKGKSLNMP